MEGGLPLRLSEPIDMEYIYLITGILTIAFAVAGLVLTCYLEQRWLNSRKAGPDRSAPSSLSADGLST